MDEIYFYSTTYPYQFVGIGEISNNIIIHYIAPQLQLRLFMPNKKTSLLADFSVGRISYNNEEKFYISNALIKGKSTGYSTGLSMDFPLSKHFALGMGITYTHGEINDVEIETDYETREERLDKAENISRWDFSLGIRF